MKKPILSATSKAYKTVRSILKPVIGSRVRIPASFREHGRVEKLARQPLSRIIETFGGLSMIRSIPKKQRALYDSLYIKHRVPHPIKPYNKARDTFVNNNAKARKLIHKFIERGRVRTMVDPIGGTGGINPMYVYDALNKVPPQKAYAIVRNDKKLQAFALFNNKKGYINVISAMPTYGGVLLKKIINNNPSKNIRLSAVPDEKLLGFYKKHGFVQTKPSKNLIPMTRIAHRNLLSK